MKQPKYDWSFIFVFVSLMLFGASGFFFGWKFGLVTMSGAYLLLNIYIGLASK